MIAFKWIYATGVLLSYGLLCAFFIQRHLQREFSRKAQVAGFVNAGESLSVCVVAYASQTGQAEELAFQTARFLHDGGESVRLVSLGELTSEKLQQCRRLLCIASTYGEGDAPDSAAPFVSKVMQSRPLNLTGLEFAVLALGDSSYKHFCGFGRAVFHRLQSCGARPLFDLVEVDSRANDRSSKGIETWRQGLMRVLEIEKIQWRDTQVFSPWLIRARKHLNPHSSGREVHHIELVPADGEVLPDWQAGDLVQLEVPGVPGALRDYSIASIPQDGAVHLLVRLAVREDGSAGLASGWLTQRAILNDRVQLRIRTHPAFRMAENTARPLLLIGNGTGLAGLRAHLRARFNERVLNQDIPLSSTWLIFGERHAQFDSYYREEIDDWIKQDLLSRADLVFSRDQPQRRYVQHVLAECASDVREWVEQGAAIYVCGSLKGMAAEVDAQLKQTLGEDAVKQLSLNGRYRRDVY
ncbi:sulfite reductase (NADPH) flavoprotein alpha-component [Limnobacter thiooxidans]|uniref:NADPH--hemoprotein reductase n=1 Tax=Limnobacter thiooxidans TaxID=131080 RepID=A0AA86J1U0_9BURK|nr:sulfite reductase (NADPH) flavoprotein alpha-component [Limnobacter thiooxidans]BET26843.1 sulfite reductase subunit alpha [Limnobacter thiooxidans]